MFKVRRDIYGRLIPIEDEDDDNTENNTQPLVKCEGGCMSATEYRAFLDLLMCSDPYPVDDNGVGEQLLLSFADDQSHKYGFTCWVEAYHQHKVNE